MSLPGPPGIAWAVGLLLWALAAAILGEGVRILAAHWVGSWRHSEPIERILLDFYLGGAVIYLVAALPVGAFATPVVVGLPVVAAAFLLARAARWNAPAWRDRLDGARSAWARPGPILAVLCALALFAFELAIALPIGTGNTYDSSLLTVYVALLLQHHTLPLTFQPYAAGSILYPQATTAWLGWAQMVLGPPAARTSLLVTPLFFALAPLGAYVFGRRTFGTEGAGIALAVALTAVGSWTRVLVTGSNDFVFAFPLVLLLAGQATAGVRGGRPTWPDAVAFGGLLGYSAAMNPVGAEWLVPALVVAGLWTYRRSLSSAIGWLGRCGAAVAAALLALAPTLFVLGQGWDSPGFTPGSAASPPGTPVGISFAQFVGYVDPYLFRPTDVWLSPLPLVRDELAVLLTVGLAVLVVAPTGTPIGRRVARFREFSLIAGAVVVVWLIGAWLESTGGSAFGRLAVLSSPHEMSIWLFTFYTFVAATPLILVVEWILRPPELPASPGGPAPDPRGWRTRRAPSTRPVAVLLALVIVVPGAALTVTQLPSVLHQGYTDFGNVSATDFALLEYAGIHLPAGARVLVAPGSAAEFLPGYAPNLVLLYPLVPGFPWGNSSYRVVLSQLTNATLNATGLAAMNALNVQYILVTGANTILWPPLSPTPLLADPGEFAVLWHEGPDYLFERNGG